MAPIVVGLLSTVLLKLTRYKEDLTPEQKQVLMDLIKFKNHYQISAEVRHELVNSGCRGEVKDVEMV